MKFSFEKEHYKFFNLAWHFYHRRLFPDQLLYFVLSGDRPRKRSNKFDLKSYVLSSLAIAFQLNPMRGWIKLKEEYDQSFLVKLNELQQKYNELQDKYINLKEKTLIETENDIEKYKQQLKVEYFFGWNFEFKEEQTNKELHEIEFTYLELLFGLSEVILSVNSPDLIVKKISSLIFNLLQGTSFFEIFSKKEKSYNVNEDRFIITFKT